MKYLKLITIFSILLVVLFAVSCQKESTGDDDSEDTEETDGTGGSGSAGSLEATWARNDGQGNAYLKLNGTTAIACSGGTATTGTYNSGASTMTFVVGGQTIVFPLRMKNGKLIVGIPEQGTANNQETEYVKSDIWPCGSGGGTGTGGGGTGTGGGGGTTPPAKGSLIVWTSQPASGWGTQGINGMDVSVGGVSNSSAIFAGHYTSPPSCGAVYCYTIELPPGQYTVFGKVYFLRGLDGVTPPTYSTSQNVQVLSGQCANVMLK